MERNYITFRQGPNGPSIDLINGSLSRVVIFAERADPQPPGLPDNLVAVVLPQNCYLDTNEPCTWPTIEVTGDPMVGRCSRCDADLEKLAAMGEVSHMHY